MKDLSIDLTVKEIYELKNPGSLDFSGSEYIEPEKNKIKPKKKTKKTPTDGGNSKKEPT